jgi:isocitrate/isopropylmalate dehydrogenase
MMLETLEFHEAANRLRQAVLEVLAGSLCTPDLGGKAGTLQFVKAVEERLQ